jgi:hypothetical protein
LLIPAGWVSAQDEPELVEIYIRPPFTAAIKCVPSELIATELQLSLLIPAGWVSAQDEPELVEIYIRPPFTAAIKCVPSELEATEDQFLADSTSDQPESAKLELKFTLATDVGIFPAPGVPPKDAAQWSAASDQFPAPAHSALKPNT